MKIPNATYLSPNLRYDAAAQVVIFERVNPDTGVVTFQAPSREAIKDEMRVAAVSADQAAQAAVPKADAVPPAGELKAATQAQFGGDKPRISILV
jgi:hypothetical protein